MLSTIIPLAMVCSFKAWMETSDHSPHRNHRRLNPSCAVEVSEDRLFEKLLSCFLPTRAFACKKTHLLYVPASLCGVQERSHCLPLRADEIGKYVELLCARVASPILQSNLGINGQLSWLRILILCFLNCSHKRLRSCSLVSEGSLKGPWK